jgi:hypothetical protein
MPSAFQRNDIAVGLLCSRLMLPGELVNLLATQWVGGFGYH